MGKRTAYFRHEVFLIPFLLRLSPVAKTKQQKPSSKNQVAKTKQQKPSSRIIILGTNFFFIPFLVCLSRMRITLVRLASRPYLSVVLFSNESFCLFKYKEPDDLARFRVRPVLKYFNLSQGDPGMPGPPGQSVSIRLQNS